VGLLFKDLQYAIGSSADQSTKILKGVSGRVNPGQMCALMGGSGAGACHRAADTQERRLRCRGLMCACAVRACAGKSTLLDVLAYRKTRGYITGEYYIDGKAEKPSSRWYSYVTQDNVHIPIFTVSGHTRSVVRPPLGTALQHARTSV
jgi:ABC-type multidrug transport system ATPase subunit